MPLTGARLYHDRSVQSRLFLKARVAVIPVGTGLMDREAVGEGLARRDALEAQARHTIHVGRKNDPVPVNGARGRQAIGDAQGDRVAFAPAQKRPGELTIDHGCNASLSGEVHRLCADLQVELRAGQCLALGSVRRLRECLG